MCRPLHDLARPLSCVSQVRTLDDLTSSGWSVAAPLAAPDFVNAHNEDPSSRETARQAVDDGERINSLPDGALMMTRIVVCPPPPAYCSEHYQSFGLQHAIPLYTARVVIAWAGFASACERESICAPSEGATGTALRDDAIIWRVPVCSQFVSKTVMAASRSNRSRNALIPLVRMAVR